MNIRNSTQVEFNELNRANLNHFKKWWKNIKKVMIISSQDEQVCKKCRNANHRVVDFEKATLPPVPNCKNEVCRCYYIGHVKKKE